MHEAIIGVDGTKFAVKTTKKMSQPRPSEIQPSPNPPPCAEPNLLGDDQIESEVNSLEALADDITGN